MTKYLFDCDPQLTIAFIVFPQPQAFNFINQFDEVAFAFVFDA